MPGSCFKGCRCGCALAYSATVLTLENPYPLTISAASVLHLPVTKTNPGSIAGAASASAECASTTCSFGISIESCSDRSAARSDSESQPWLVTKTKGAPESRTWGIKRGGGSKKKVEEVEVEIES